MLVEGAPPVLLVGLLEESVYGLEKGVGLSRAIQEGSELSLELFVVRGGFEGVLESPLLLVHAALVLFGLFMALVSVKTRRKKFGTF